MGKREYVADVLRQYISLPHTPDRARRNDRRLAADLFDQGVSRETVFAALALAVVRRTMRRADAPPLDAIRSLAYFRPVIEEVLHNPLVDEAYIRYISRHCQQILADPASAASVPQTPQGSPNT